MVQSKTIQELIAIGRPAGHLSSNQLQRVLPVDTMSIDEIADVVLQLERSGIEVDLDPALLEPGPHPIQPRALSAQAELSNVDEARHVGSAPLLAPIPQSPALAPAAVITAGVQWKGLALPIALVAVAVIALVTVLWLTG
jgi:hypothetical protein